MSCQATVRMIASTMAATTRSQKPAYRTAVSGGRASHTGGGGGTEPEVGTLGMSVSWRNSSGRLYHERVCENIVQRPLALGEGGHDVADSQRHHGRHHVLREVTAGGAAEGKLGPVEPYDAQAERHLAEGGAAQ